MYYIHNFLFWMWLIVINRCLALINFLMNKHAFKQSKRHLSDLFCNTRISSPYKKKYFLYLFVFVTKYAHPISLSLPDSASLCYCQFIERAICWCASLRQEPDALSDRLDASDPQWLAPVRRTGGSSTGMLGRPLWHTGTLPPHSSVSPPQLTAYLHHATAYKDTWTQKNI